MSYFRTIVLFLAIYAPLAFSGGYTAHNPGGVPEYMFHFGLQKYLVEDAELNKIPDYAWDNFIMGDKTRFKLPKVRRGLYGGNDINYISEYASKCGPTNNGKPWMMVIHIADECQDYKTLGHIADVMNDGHFKDWYKENMNPGTIYRKTDRRHKSYDREYKVLLGGNGKVLFRDVKDFSKSAYGTKKPRKPVLPNIKYHKYYTIPQNAELHKAHEFVLQKYVEARGFKILINENTPSSWYVRDQSCIEKIDGEAAEVVHWISKRQDFWNPKFNPKNAIWPGSILFQALSELDTVNDTDIDNLVKLINNKKLELGLAYDPSHFRKYMTWILENIQTCSKNFKDGPHKEVLKAHINQHLKSCLAIDLQALNSKIKKACDIKF